MHIYIFKWHWVFQFHGPQFVPWKMAELSVNPCLWALWQRSQIGRGKEEVIYQEHMTMLQTLV